MLLKIFSKIPLLQCLFFYPWDAHKTAIKKFFVLWLFTSLPIIFAAILSKIPEGNYGDTSGLLVKIKDSITVSELFIYTASFLTPILYMIFEKITSIPREEIGEKITKGIRGIFTGYELVALISFIIIIITAIAFGQIKTNEQYFRDTYLNHYLTEYSLIIYIFSLYCWYLTLLDGAWSGDFVRSNRKTENIVSSQFSDRLRNRENNNE